MRQACAGSLARIRVALGQGEWTQALAELHSMKGAFLVGRMAAAADACAQMEARVRAGERDRAAEAFGELERITAEALEHGA
jgi:HPt (histidine-containing phosphotransfer) domain-containing protein